MKKIFLTSLILFAGLFSAFAQGKIGHVNVEFILAKMPEMKNIDSELKTYQSQLEAQIRDKYQKIQELQKQLQDPSLPPAVKASKQEELQFAAQNVETYQQNAEYDMLGKQEQLMSPLLEKIQNKINEVAKDKDLDYVLMSGIQGTNFILYAKNDDDNITVAVLKKLGVELSPEELEKAKGVSDVKEATVGE